MKIIEQEIEGLYLIEPDLIHDSRGYFSEVLSIKEFSEIRCAQWNIAWNKLKGTLRGLHIQHEPHEEIKIVRCVKGSIFDVVIDLRKDSKTYEKVVTNIINDKNKNTLYIPAGCAHGYQTLEDDTEIFYQTSALYTLHSCETIKHYDQRFCINWPLQISNISEKDK